MAQPHESIKHFKKPRLFPVPLKRSVGKYSLSSDIPWSKVTGHDDPVTTAALNQLFAAGAQIKRPFCD